MRLMMASSPSMRDLGRWILIGLAVMVAGLTAIGYGLIASGVAAPIGGGLGTVAVPAERGAVPVFLADGRPAFVVRTDDAVLVLDARPPLETGTPGALVGWCGGHDQFFDWVHGGWYLADGTRIADAPSGLIAYPITRAGDEQHVTVGSEGSPVTAVADPSTLGGCDGNEAVMHEPDLDEAFDPSVAADEEPPGWIWIEGRLVAIGNQALLCDDLDATDCATGAVVRGIDPAELAALSEPMAGYFLGRVGDGVIDELHHVPLSVRGS
jgi:hypothetical protein